MAEPKIILENIVCPFCGCLCDDLKISIDDNKIVDNQNGCAISKTKFLGHTEGRLRSPTVKNGSKHNEVSLQSAIATAGPILSNSRRLLVYGLSSTENDAHREAYKIAEILGGVVDNTSSVCHGPTIIGNQESGEPQGSLAETRARADLVIYWGANPQFAHPRHMSRYTKPLGKYAKEREIWVFDIRKTTSAVSADRFIRIEPGCDLEIITALRAILRGVRLDRSSVGGLSIDELSDIANAMKTAKYGVLFFGLGLSQSKGKHHNIHNFKK